MTSIQKERNFTVVKFVNGILENYKKKEKKTRVQTAVMELTLFVQIAQYQFKLGMYNKENIWTKKIITMPKSPFTSQEALDELLDKVYSLTIIREQTKR